MSDSGTTNSNKTSSTTYHPHYFTTFQNYCCGPRSKTTNSSTSNDLLPIPNDIKEAASKIVHDVNEAQKNRIADLSKSTSRIPHQFFDEATPSDYQRCLIDRSMLKTMFDAQVINWFPSLKKLYPIRTSGNGNCLLHAILISMTGTHDFHLLLRDRLVQYMEKNNEQLKQVWRIERIRSDKANKIDSEDALLDVEWEEIRNLARFDNSGDEGATKNYQFLESIHVFTISNMLARPIIVLSEEYVRNKDGEAIGYNDLYGIYLPILTNSRPCHQEPLILGYDQSHFCPLLTDDAKPVSQNENYVPLHQSVESARQNKLLPMRFLGRELSPEKIRQELKKYLRVKELLHIPENTTEHVPTLCAVLGSQFPFEKYNLFKLYFDYLTNFTQTLKQQKEDVDQLGEKYLRQLKRDDDIRNPIISNEMNNIRLNDRFNTNSPPPPPAYPGLEGRSTHNFERRSSYDKAINNGTASVLIEPTIRSSASATQERFSTPKTSQQNGINSRSHEQKSTWEHSVVSNGDDSSVKDTSSTNKNNSSPRTSESKLKQDPHKFYTDQHVNRQFTNVPSVYPDLIDFDKKTDRIRSCIICKNHYEDIRSSAVCPDCDSQINNPSSRRTIVIRHAAPRTPATALPPIHFTSYAKQSDFLTPNPIPVQPPPIRPRNTRSMICSFCRATNVVNLQTYQQFHTCFGCGHHLQVPFY